MNELLILGRSIGVIREWDYNEDDDLTEFVFYDFVPHKKFADRIPCGDVTVDFRKGTIEPMGTGITIDMVDLLKDFPRTLPTSLVQRVQ